MKLITAIIQPRKLQSVQDSLFKAGIAGVTISNVIGCGQQYGCLSPQHETIHEFNLLPKVRLEAAVSDHRLEEIIDVIIEAAYTGHIGDGKIFVTPLLEAIRIRTRDRGNSALAKSSTRAVALV